MQPPIRLTAVLAGLTVALAGPASAQFHFSTGQPDGLMATGSRPSQTGLTEIESGDDFVVATDTKITHATFYGLLPVGVSLSDVAQVRAEIYRVFPKDSNFPPSGRVLTRVNSPSDVAFAERDSAVADLTFSTSVVSSSFTTNNSVLNGIHPFPNQKTGGEGSVTGQEVLFDVSFVTPFALPADHYFFVPQVGLNTGDFFWLSAPKPITGGPPFAPDLQTWIRDENLAPDWLRVGTDIVGGAPAPTFNAAFSLDGTAVPEPATTGWFGAGVLVLGLLVRWRRRASPPAAPAG